MPFFAWSASLTLFPGCTALPFESLGISEHALDRAWTRLWALSGGPCVPPRPRRTLQEKSGLGPGKPGSRGSSHQARERRPGMTGGGLTELSQCV